MKMVTQSNDSLLHVCLENLYFHHSIQSMLVVKTLYEIKTSR